MPQSCRTCALGPKKVKQLETDYINGMNINKLRNKYGVSYASIKFHLESHLPEKLVNQVKDQEAFDQTQLLNRINEIDHDLHIIYERNFKKKKDEVAVKAAKERRNTLDLLARISMALDKHKTRETEPQQKTSAIEIPVHELSNDAQNLLFEIAQKQLSQDTSMYENLKPEIREPENRGVPTAEDQNNSKKSVKIKRTRFNGSDDKMTFQPIQKNAPLNDPKVNLKRRLWSRLLESSEEKHHPSTPGSPFF